MPHTLDVTKIGEVLEELALDDRLTNWERGFVESLAAQHEEGRQLSERQLEVLERVWCKY